MKYNVELTRRADADIEEAYLYIHDDSPSNAIKWRIGLTRVCESLAKFPMRCPVAPESAYFGREVRHAFFVRYRIIYAIKSRRVTILHVRHSARLPLNKGN